MGRVGIENERLKGDDDCAERGPGPVEIQRAEREKHADPEKDVVNEHEHMQRCGGRHECEQDQPRRVEHGGL